MGFFVFGFTRVEIELNGLGRRGERGGGRGERRSGRGERERQGRKRIGG
jgi:hypothetical protein